MENTVRDIVDWIKTWDFMAILYRFVAALLVALVLKLTGVFGWISRQHKLKKGIRAYRRRVLEDCSSLIVIGKRQGFSIKDVFVELDLAPSDLTGSPKDGRTRPEGCYVLVGGPGAGKSTMAKHQIISHLTRSQGRLPLYVRLREYAQSESIEEHLVSKVRSHGIEDAEGLIRTILQTRDCLCVLDGLDETRPHLRDQVCDHINHFYQKYFSSSRSGRLIVTCRKEAYRSFPLDIPEIWEVRPLTNQQIQRFAAKWPLGFPKGKSSDTFWRDLASTERILELTRCPLLLVGALMQYTESNLGIPDERIEYLARIGQWLVSDWAVAQGHPPDPWRPAYERILARLALDMHISQEFEYPTDKTIDLIKNWLPHFGYQSENAAVFLENIMTRTGILVRDTPGTVVFAQFSLQEYFASMEAVAQLGPERLASRSSEGWWREVIPLAVAQEQNPTPCLEALFAASPLMATLAVAECPTPSIEMQQRAIQACVTGIDAGEDVASPATVSLLRKVVGQQESVLCSELEQRLEGTAPDIASTVGQILATVGTSAASQVLARHPSVWPTGLETAGYLSDAFENLLVDWIEHGSDTQSNRAAELLCSRMSIDRLNELLELLPRLPRPRADFLARNLLTVIGNRGQRRLGGPEEGVLVQISKCVPYVGDPKSYLDVAETGSHSSHDVRSVIATALFMTTAEQPVSAETILRRLMHSASWWQSRGFLLCCVASGMVIMASLVHPQYRVPILVLNMAVFLYAIIRPFSHPAWASTHRAFDPRHTVSIPATLAGSLVVLAMGATFSSAQPVALLPILGISLCYTLSGVILSYRPPLTLVDVPCAREIRISLVWAGLLVLALIVYRLAPRLSSTWISIFALTFAFWVARTSLALSIGWRKVRNAHRLSVETAPDFHFVQIFASVVGMERTDSERRIVGHPILMSFEDID